MQVRVDNDNPTLEDACHPLGKLQFVADTIIAVNAMKSSDGFYEFNQSGMYSMGEIVQESIDELKYLIYEVGMGIDPETGRKVNISMKE